MPLAVVDRCLWRHRDVVGPLVHAQRRATVHELHGNEVGIERTAAVEQDDAGRRARLEVEGEADERPAAERRECRERRVGNETETRTDGRPQTNRGELSRLTPRKQDRPTPLTVTPPGHADNKPKLKRKLGNLFI